MQSNLTRIFGFFCLLISVHASAATYDSLRTEVKNDSLVVFHRVDAGETLYALSKRYDVPIAAIQKYNGLPDLNISLTQVLKIPVGIPSGDQEVSDNEITDQETTYHEVAPRETLFSISRAYGLTVAELKELNQLSSNELSIGQKLMVGAGEKASGNDDVVVKKEKEAEDSEKMEPAEEEIPDGFTQYYVQTGERLEGIAAKFKVNPDSIVLWNNLSNSYLTIGQQLLIKGEIDSLSQTQSKKYEQLAYGTRKRVKDQSGFVKIYEEGTAKKIEDIIETDKYLLLHRELPIGALVEVRNLMNNKKVYARVVGKLPETGLNRNVLVRLTPICFERLGVIDPKTRVEVSYYED